jgi:hypothetical protein
LCHDSDLHHVEQRERVFLRPQWLVDVMKALVHHDLAGRIDGVDSSVTNAVEVKSLGKHFMQTGELDRRLLPWLWRELEPPVGDDDAQMQFLVGLLVQLGLLTELPAAGAAAAGGESAAAGVERWLLSMRLPDRQTAMRAHGSFEALRSAMDNDSPVLGLRESVQPIVAAGMVTEAAMGTGCQTAADKVAALAQQGPDPHGLSDDEIAAINLFTQDVLYGALNSALRSEAAEKVRPFWGYIRLLNTALDRLPESQAGAVFRGIKEPGSHCYTLDGLQKKMREGTPEIWWGFSSTSTNLEAVNSFLGGARSTAKRVIFTVDGGSRARDVKRYSSYEAEDELMLPCGTAFEVKTASSPAPNLLLVKLKETQATLFGSGRVAEPPALTELAQLLDAEGAAVDNASRQLDFHQQIPTGLMGLVLNRCAARLCGGNPTSIWRRDLRTIVPALRAEAMVLDATTSQYLADMKLSALHQQARDMGVAAGAVDTLMDDETISKAAERARLMELIAWAPLKIEVAVSQEGPSCVALHARCLRDGGNGLHVACVRQLVAFESVIEAVLTDSWPGCSASATGDTLESAIQEEQPEPEPEPELVWEPEPEEEEECMEEGVPPPQQPAQPGL